MSDEESSDEWHGIDDEADYTEIAQAPPEENAANGTHPFLRIDESFIFDRRSIYSTPSQTQTMRN
jgi:hypothetical protein